jgi:competence protein ComEA
MLNFNKIVKKNLMFILMGICLIVVYWFINIRDTNTNLVIKDEGVSHINIEQPLEKEEKNTSQKEEKMIYIDLKGAVNYPGVYEMKLGSRVKDLLNEAGGFTLEADSIMINLAQVLEDEMVIYVPKQGEIEPNISGNLTTPNDGLVNINIATLAELENLAGIGPAKAEAIIAYRNELGKFKSIEELKEVSGIGEGVFNQIKDEISVK